VIGKEAIEELGHCNKCGFCLPVCPTYRETGSEVASPRGRLSLMEAVALGELPIAGEFADAMDLCLGCRACERACPSGVRFGRALEAAREAVADAGVEATVGTPAVRRLRSVLLTSVTQPRRLRRGALGLRLYQRSGVRDVARALGLDRVLPAPLGGLEPMLPDVAGENVRRALRRVCEESERTGEGAVALFPGCIMDAVFAPAHLATARLLAAAGAKVRYVASAGCCGALHAHAGRRSKARDLARQTIAAFEQAGAEVYVNNAGGCGAMLHEYPDLLRDDPAWRERAQAFADRMVDLSVALERLPRRLRFRGTGRRVTYQDSCHLVNGQGVVDPPRRLMAAVKGDSFVDMPDAQACCGSAGIYNLTRYDMSMRVLERKMDSCLSVAPDVVVTANPGCTLQMRLGVHRRGASAVQVLHLAEYLASCLEA
jgi:glycolate oxidase iron-sulfur subunit